MRRLPSCFGAAVELVIVNRINALTGNRIRAFPLEELGGPTDRPLTLVQRRSCLRAGSRRARRRLACTLLPIFSPTRRQSAGVQDAAHVFTQALLYAAVTRSAPQRGAFWP